MRTILLTVLLVAFGLACGGIGYRAGARTDRLMLDYATGFSTGRQQMLTEIAQFDEVVATSLVGTSRAIAL